MALLPVAAVGLFIKRSYGKNRRRKATPSGVTRVIDADYPITA